MTLEEMDFGQINHHARYEGFSIDEMEKIQNFGIIMNKKREHLCLSCGRRYECYLEDWFVGGSEKFNVTECRYWEEK